MSDNIENKKEPTILKVGITGGIGSGKTTVCKIFEAFGIPIYYADDRAKKIMIEDKELIMKIKSLLGKDAYFEDGSLNRAYIGNIIFNDKDKLQKMNSIVHPAVFFDGERWHKEQTEVPYTLKEAALLFEGGGYKLMDKMITVFAPKEVRLERVMKRDNVEAEAVLARMNKQMPDEEKVKLADFVIYNDGSQSLIKQVKEIHEKLKELA